MVVVVAAVVPISISISRWQPAQTASSASCSSLIELFPSSSIWRCTLCHLISEPAASLPPPLYFGTFFTIGHETLGCTAKRKGKENGKKSDKSQMRRVAKRRSERQTLICRWFKVDWDWGTVQRIEKRESKASRDRRAGETKLPCRSFLLPTSIRIGLEM